MAVILKAKQNPALDTSLTMGPIFHLVPLLLACQAQSIANFIIQILSHQMVSINKGGAFLGSPEVKFKAVKLLVRYNNYNLRVLNHVLFRCLLHKIRRSGFDVNEPRASCVIFVHKYNEPLPELVKALQFIDMDSSAISLLLPLHLEICSFPFKVVAKDLSPLLYASPKDSSPSHLREHFPASTRTFTIYEWLLGSSVADNLKAWMPKGNYAPDAHCSFCRINAEMLTRPPTDYPVNLNQEPFFGQFYIDWNKRLTSNLFQTMN